MSTDEHECTEPVCADEQSSHAVEQVVLHRGRTVGILIAVLLATEVSKDIAFSHDLGDWLPACALLYFGVITCSPFVLAKMAPEASGFDTQWLPGSRWHWAWFLGMLFLLLAVKVLPGVLAATFSCRPPPARFIGPVTPIGIVLLGIAIVFIGPVAEEIFFRGYILVQLGKLTRSGVALLIQSLLFWLSHLYTRGLFSSPSVFYSIHILFLLGVILGWWRIRFKSLLPIVLGHVLFNASAIIPLKARYDQAVDRSRARPPTISKETTYITEPLRADGYPDYVAVLDRRFREGVTPENNAAVLFWQAMGPAEILEKYRERHFQQLGIPPPPEKGDYFVDLDKYIALQKDGVGPENPRSEEEAGKDAWERLDLPLKRPWSKQEFPVLAAWLATNEKPLAILVEASKRPKRYDPLVCGKKIPLIAVLLPAHGQYAFVVTRALKARAMLRINEGMANEAWEDLLACHRFARLVGQSPLSVDVMMARGIEESGCARDQSLLQHAHLTAAQATRLQTDLSRLPLMPTIADTFNVGQRFEYLDSVLLFSRDGTKATVAELQRTVTLTDEEEWKGLKGTVQSLSRYSADEAVDWDLVLRMGNSWYDRIADACRKPTRAERRQLLRRIDEDLRNLKKAAEDTASLDRAMALDPHRAFSERVGQVLLVMFGPNASRDVEFADRVAMRFELVKLAFALAAYHADRGAYPEMLVPLVPKYVAGLPKDFFNDRELRYRREGAGFVLYSVGVNGDDDSARTYEDRKNNEDWDDLAVRMPAR